MAAALTGSAVLITLNNLHFLSSLLSGRFLTPAEGAVAWVPVLASLAAALLLMLLCRQIGLATLARTPGIALRSSVAPAIGAGVIGGLFFVTGWAGAYTRTALVAIALAGGALALARQRRDREESEAPEKAPSTLLAIAVAAVALFAVWHACWMALAPVTDYDSLAYQLVIPARYLDAGRVIPLPWLLPAHWPHLLQTIYGLFLSLRLESAPGLFNLLGAVALGFLMYRSGLRWTDRRSALLSVALLATCPLVTRFAGTARADLWWAYLQFGALVLLWRWRETASDAGLMAAGFLAGSAAAAKLPGLVAFVTMAVWLAVQGSAGRTSRLVRFAGPAFLALSPWWLFTWLTTGHPLWPYLGATSGGAAALRQAYDAANRWSRPSEIWINGPQWLLIPWVILWGLYRATPGRPPFPPFLRYLLLLMLPSALAVSSRFVAWRLMTPWLPAITLTIAWLGATAWMKDGWRRATAALVVVLPIAAGLRLSQADDIIAALRLRFARNPSLDAREAYITVQFPGYAIEKAVNAYRAALAPQDRPVFRVLVYSDRRLYYLGPYAQWGDALHQRVIDYDRLDSGDAVVRAWQREGISHVLWMPDPYYVHPARVDDLVARALQQHGRRLFSDATGGFFQLTVPRGETR